MSGRPSEGSTPVGRVAVDAAAVTVVLSGDLDAGDARLLDERLRRLEADAPPVVVVDLRRVRSLDVAVLHCLTAAAVRARCAGRTLTLIDEGGGTARVVALA